jgi:hypothetical protein
MKKILLSVLLILTSIQYCYAKPLTLNEITQASVRVSTDSAWGSGTCVYFDGNFYYVLTNAHVVGNSSTASVEFFAIGWKTSFIEGPVIWKKFQELTDVDFAIIKIDKSKLGKFRTRVIPLIPANSSFDAKAYLQSVGCPEARWAQAFEGHFIGGDESRLLFTPPPRPGQSGSGIHVNIKDANGEYHTYVGAIITWLIGTGTGKDANGFDLAQGGAIPISTFYKVLEQRTDFRPNKVPSHYQYVVYHTHEYALARDGKYYIIQTKPDGSRFVRLPKGMEVLEWGITLPCKDATGCPGPYCQPPEEAPSPGPNVGPGPSQPPSNQLPPGFGDGSGGLDVPDELNDELKKLQEQYNALLKEKAALETRLAEKEKEVELLKKTLQEQDALIKKLQQDIKILQDDLAVKNKTIDELSTKLKDTIDALGQCNSRLNEIEVNPPSTFGVWITKGLDKMSSLLQYGIYLLLGLGIFTFGLRLFRRFKKSEAPVTNTQPQNNNQITGCCDWLLKAWKVFEDRLFDRLENFLEQQKQVDPPSVFPPGPVNPPPPTPPVPPIPPITNLPHPDFIEPPGVVQPPQYNPKKEQPLYPKAPSPYIPKANKDMNVDMTEMEFKPVTGYGPVPPNMPATQHTAQDILAAVDELSRRHSMDDRLSTVSQLVRQILTEPRRK